MYILEHRFTIDQWTPEVHAHIKKMRDEALKHCNIQVPTNYGIAFPKCIKQEEDENDYF